MAFSQAFAVIDSSASGFRLPPEKWSLASSEIIILLTPHAQFRLSSYSGKI